MNLILRQGVAAGGSIAKDLKASLVILSIVCLKKQLLQTCSSLVSSIKQNCAVFLFFFYYIIKEMSDVGEIWLSLSMKNVQLFWHACIMIYF